MLVRIPSSKTEVDTTDERYVIVNHDEFLMMCPVESHISGVFEDVVIGMAHHSDVTMTGCSLGAEITQRMFGVCGITSQGLIHLSQ